MKKARIKWLVLCVALVTLIISGVSFAWLFLYRKIDNIGVIKAPVHLELRAGGLESIQQFDLGEIDASAPSRSQSYVFAVYGDKGSQYKIQLAYTTNIPFTYTIYSAKQYLSEEAGNAATGKSEADVVYTEHKDSDAVTYYYYKKDNIPYVILNQNGIVAKADGKYHNKTYGESESDNNAYSHVQINAEPMYWQSEALYTLGKGQYSEEITGLTAVDYYILTVSWTEDQITTGQILNNKETDLIYITIGQEKKEQQ